MNSKPFDCFILTLIIIGAVNWGLIGFFQFDFIAMLFGGMNGFVSRIIYAVVGLSGLYALSMYTKLDNDMSDTARQHHTR